MKKRLIQFVAGLIAFLLGATVWGVSDSGGPAAAESSTFGTQIVPGAMMICGLGLMYLSMFPWRKAGAAKTNQTGEQDQ